MISGPMRSNEDSSHQSCALVFGSMVRRDVEKRNKLQEARGLFPHAGANAGAAAGRIRSDESPIQISAAGIRWDVRVGEYGSWPVLLKASQTLIAFLYWQDCISKVTFCPIC